MRKIAVLNQKGGVGKTTTVANTAAFLAGMGLKVVVADLDPQAHLTIHFGVEPESVEAGSYKVISQTAGIEEELVNVRENIWLLAANINLVGAESELVSVVGRETIFREAVEPIEGKYDYMLVDCAPSLGLLTLNALAACDEVLIPLQPHFLALQGFGKLLQTIDLVNKRINPNLKVLGVLLCMFDSRTSLSVEVRADIEKFLNGARGTNSAWAQAQLLPVYIRRNVKLAEAPSYGKTIIEYEKDCHGAEDYKKVAEFISGRLFPISDANLQQAQSEQEIVESQQEQQNDLQQEETEIHQKSEVQCEESIRPEQIISELKNHQRPDMQQEDSKKTTESAVPPTE